MSIVAVLVEPRRVVAVTDTRITHLPRGRHAPRDLATKVVPLPSHRGLLAFSGSTLVGAQVYLSTFDAASADLGALVGPLADELPGLVAVAREAYRDDASTGAGIGVVLAGWSPSRGRMVGHALRLERGRPGVEVETREAGALLLPDVIEDPENLTDLRGLMLAVDVQLEEAGPAAGGALWRYVVAGDGGCLITLARPADPRETARAA